MKKIKLNQLSQNKMEKMELNKLLGGQWGDSGCCACGCVGLSSTSDNGGANNHSGLHSPGGGTGDAGMDARPGGSGGQC